MKFNIFKRTPATRLLFFIACDVVLISLAIYLSFILRFDGVVPLEYFDNQEIYKIIFWTLLFCLPLFYFFGLYSFSWSYVSTRELLSLLKASTLGFVFVGVTIFFSGEFPLFVCLPRLVFFISYILIFIFCGALRMSKRIYLINFGNKKNESKNRALIVGAGDAGEQILRSIMSSVKSLYLPVGFVDDDDIKQGVVIHGLKVLGRIKDIPELVKIKDIKQIIIALPSNNNKKIKESINLSRAAGIKKIKIAPLLSEVIKGELSLNLLKNVEVEDLLGRQEIQLEEGQIKTFIKDKSILITGAAGSIGSELSRQIIKFNPREIVLLDQDETGIFNIYNELLRISSSIKIVPIISDILDKEKIEEVLQGIILRWFFMQQRTSTSL